MCLQTVTSTATVESTIVHSIVTATVSSTKPSDNSGPDATTINTVPLVLMPMSPVAVVSPMQVIKTKKKTKIGQNIVSMLCVIR